MSLPFAGIVVVWSGDKPRHDVYRIGERFVLGRDIVDATDDRISRQHTAFTIVDSQLRVADCNSRNGTYLEHHAVTVLGATPPLPAIIRSGRTLSIALADCRGYEHVPISRRGSLVVAGSLAKQVRAVDAAALAEENVMIFGTASVGRELGLGYAKKLGGSCVVLETHAVGSIAKALEANAPMRTVIVVVTSQLGEEHWAAFAPWFETDVRFVFVMRHETQPLGMPTALAMKLAGTVISIPRLRFDELPTTLLDILRARVPDAQLHASAVEETLLRARITDEDVLLAAFRAAVDRWDRTGELRAEHL